VTPLNIHLSYSPAWSVEKRLKGRWLPRTGFADLACRLLSLAAWSHAPTPLAEPRGFTLKGRCPVWVIQRPGPGGIVSVKLLIRAAALEDPGHNGGARPVLAGLLSRGCRVTSVVRALADLGLNWSGRCSCAAQASKKTAC